MADCGNHREICCIGGGIRGIEKAFLESRRQNQIVYCAFNLTPLTRNGPLTGTFDVVVHQDMERAAHTAVDSLVHHFEGKAPSPGTIPTELIMVENLR